MLRDHPLPEPRKAWSEHPPVLSAQSGTGQRGRDHARPPNWWRVAEPGAHPCLHWSATGLSGPHDVGGCTTPEGRRAKRPLPH